MNWLMVVGVIALVLWFIREHMAVRVPENVALILVDAWGNLRIVPAGVHFKRIWRLEEPAESPKGGVIPLRAISESFIGTFETADKSSLPFEIAYIRTPVFKYLGQYIKIDNAKRSKGIQDQIFARASIVFLSYPDRTSALADIKNIGPKIEDLFEKDVTEDDNGNEGPRLEMFYGENIQGIVAKNPELPKELADAQTKLEAQKKENDRQKAETKNYGDMAKDLVKESRELGSPISTKEAMEAVLIIQNKTKKNINVLDLGPGAQDVAGGVIGGLKSLGKGALDLADKFADKKDGKKEDGKDGR